MYIENKSSGGGISGSARIGRVTFSKSGKTVRYRGRELRSLRGSGFLANYVDAKTGEEFSISGCKRRGGDRLYPGLVHIDDDVREEYWTDIRKMPEEKDRKVIRHPGKYGGHAPR